jgi:hypothetical protein
VIEDAVVIVKPGTVVIDRGFETASWWRKLELEPGTYEFKHHAIGMYWATIPGKIIEDFFPSSLFGYTGTYDRTKNADKPANYSIMRYRYQLEQNRKVELNA